MSESAPISETETLPSAAQKVRTYGDPVLRKPVRQVTDPSSLQALVAEMWEVMYAANGVGLAAPQIGVSQQVAVLLKLSDNEQEPPQELVLVNPRLLEASSETELMEEGCLSFPGIYLTVARPRRVVVEFWDLDGNHQQVEAEGFFAREFLHEIDHLGGRLIIDRAERAALEEKRPEIEVLRRETRQRLKAQGQAKPKSAKVQRRQAP
ncbi:MAG: peptide deformylase [Deinococcus sp.]|nr:peptide deformylase [Deinococcus sp.]